MGMGLGGREGTVRDADPPAPAAQVSLCDVGPSLALSGPQSNHLYQRLRLGPDSARTWGFRLRMGGRKALCLLRAYIRVLPKGSIDKGSRALGC